MKKRQWKSESHVRRANLHLLRKAGITVPEQLKRVMESRAGLTDSRPCGEAYREAMLADLLRGI